MDLECLLNDLNDYRSLIKEVINRTDCKVEIVFNKEFLYISFSLHNIGRNLYKFIATGFNIISYYILQMS